MPRLLGLFLLFNAFALGSESWSVIRSRSYVFPYGTSHSDVFEFPKPLTYQELRFTYSGSYPCHITVDRIEVSFEDDALTETTIYPNDTGTFVLSKKGMTRLRVHNRQSKWTSITCTETIYGRMKTPVTSTFKYLGSLEAGSENMDLELALAPARKVTHFRVEIPEFCSDMVIGEAYTVTEGISDPATLTDAEEVVYAVDGGVGARISAIKLVLDKAPKRPCDIHVYGKLK